MVFVGIDVSKDSHSCHILSSNGNTLVENLVISNDSDGFNTLNDSLSLMGEEIRVALESTGHYSLNIESFLRNKGYSVTLLNPLMVDKFKKSQTLRKTKTDKSDAKLIATLLFSKTQEATFDVPMEIRELKSLTRNRSRLVKEKSNLKVQISRLLVIIFPEFKTIFSSQHRKSAYALLKIYPNIQEISNANIDKITELLRRTSRGKYSNSKAYEIIELAKKSVGTVSRALSFELQQTIRLVEIYEQEIKIIETEIKTMLDATKSPIATISGVGSTLGSIIISEIGNINRFSSPAKLLAFSGLEPTIYQSGQYSATRSRMVKRGSSYLRWALMQASRTICLTDKTFKDYLAKKRTEGKHYLVALSHVARKLVRVIFYLLKSNKKFIPQH